MPTKIEIARSILTLPKLISFVKFKTELSEKLHF